MNRDEAQESLKPNSFVFYGAMAAFGLLAILCGFVAQREVVAICGAVFVELGYLNIGRLQERKKWAARKEEQES